jgi:hypothetical protein
MDFREIWYWAAVLLKFVYKFQFWLRSDNNNGHFIWRPTCVSAYWWLGGESPGYLGCNGYYLYIVYPWNFRPPGQLWRRLCHSKRTKVKFWRAPELFCMRTFSKLLYKIQDVLERNNLPIFLTLFKNVICIKTSVCPNITLVGNSVPILKHSHIQSNFSNKRIVGSSWSFTY